MEKIRIIVEPCICVVKYLSYCYVALLLLFLSLFISFVFLLFLHSDLNSFDRSIFSVFVNSTFLLLDDGCRNITVI